MLLILLNDLLINKVISKKTRLSSRKTSQATTEKYIKARMNAVTHNFILNQPKNQNKQPKGSRYTQKDKIFALTLLKQSPKAYRLLRKIFALPSRKTVMAVNRIALTTGLNAQLMKVLAAVIQNMDELDRYCCLMFDEISLEPGLSYNTVTDSIDGFEDCGDYKSTKLANHAMVFMLHGVRRKWN